MKLLPTFLIAIFIWACLPAASAQEIIKANNTTALNNPLSWVDGDVPGSGDIAVWDSTLTADRAAAIGGSMSWSGIKSTSGFNHTINSTVDAVLTLGSAGIDLSSAGGNFTFAYGTILDLSASQTWTVAAGRTLTLSSGANIGSGTISLAGSGTFALAATSVYSNVTGVFSSGPLGLGTLNLGNGINLTASGGARALYNAVNLNGNIGVSTAGGNFFFNGGMNIGAATRTITITGGNLLYFGGFSGAAGASKTVTGTGRLVFANGNPSATPQVTVRNGSGAANDFAVFDTDVTVGSGVTFMTVVNSTFTVNTDLILDGELNMSNGAGSANTVTLGSLSGSGSVYNGTTGAGVGSLTIDGGTQTGTTNFSGNLINGANSYHNMIKTGATTQIFSGTNNYSGSTTISAGTLLVNGSHIQTATGTNNFYTVNSGGTLGGSGTIARFTNATGTQYIVTVASGGTLAPGRDGLAGFASLKLDGQNMAGTGTYRHLNMQSGAEFHFDLAGNGSNADKLDLWNYALGDLVLNNNEVNLDLLGPQVSGTYTVDLFRFYSDDGVTLTLSGITSGLAVGDLGAGIVSANFIYENEIGGASGLIKLQYTVVAIPEPSSAFLAAAGVIGLLLHRRRSRFAR